MNEDAQVLGDQALDLLRAAVRDALARKRRLGQYAVVERGGTPVVLPPDELPLGPDAESIPRNEHERQGRCR